MCGITGVLNLADRPPVSIAVIRQMLAMIRHRGPDGLGIYRDEQAGLGNARLSIIDLAGGDQPIGNEDGTVWIVFNGEIFNYVELRPGLEARGHRFSTKSDTEVIVHLYEDYGPGCLNLLNGQFAIAIWDTRNRSLFLARDRLGVRPLFYTIQDGRLLFGSEIKAILAYPGARADLDPQSLNQIFTCWGTLTPRTAFRQIYEVPPGHYTVVGAGQGLAAVATQPYWSLRFEEPRPSWDGRGDQAHIPDAEQYLDQFESLLVDATRVRLRADVPVGAYLSGGLDSSVTAAIIRNYTSNTLDTFSIAFVDHPEYDESRFQRQMAAYLGTDHQVVACTQADIGRVFPDVIWHAETPILRTAPAPMFLLSQLVRENHYKVVITGEGADEFLAGYDIFKEMKVRRFWARVPESKLRPMLLRRLYPEITDLGLVGGAYLNAFFRKGLMDIASPVYSHAIRWSNTGRIRRFLQPSWGEGDANPADQVEIPQGFENWPPLAQAQYLEVTTFLSPYLLSSQGDRVAMAHSVEGRYPFLDYRVVEFCSRLPSNLKLSGLTEKYLLKQLGRKLVPSEIWKRPKRPYRAPIRDSFFGPHKPDYVDDLLSEQDLRDRGVFNPASVAQLVRKARSGVRMSEIEGMAIVGILSTQLAHQRFVKSFQTTPTFDVDRVKIVDQLSSDTP